MESQEGEGKRSIWWTITLFFLPFLISAIFIYILYASLDWETFKVIGLGMTAYFFPPAGKETVIPLMVLNESKPINPYLAATVIAFVDIIDGLFLMWNFDLAKKIPLIGRLISMTERGGHNKLDKKPWLKKLAFIGVILFVVFPFQGSGGVGGTIVGRLVGLDKFKVWMAIIIGAVSGCLMISFLSYYAGNAIIDAFKSQTFQYISLVVVIVVISIILYFYARGKMAKKKNNSTE